MTISYYHIFNLQNDTPELNKLVNDLEIKDLILQEKETIKWKIMQFMRSLRSDIHIIAENRYVDRVYRDKMLLILKRRLDLKGIVRYARWRFIWRPIMLLRHRKQCNCSVNPVIVV